MREKDMDSHQKLIKVLEEEVATYRQLLLISKEKGNAVIEKKMANIDDLQERERHFINKITELEEKRRNEVASLRVEHGLPAGEGHVINLITSLGEAGVPLKTLTDELRAVIAEMKQVNDRNLELLQQKNLCKQRNLYFYGF